MEKSFDGVSCFYFINVCFVPEWNEIAKVNHFETSKLYKIF